MNDRYNIEEKMLGVPNPVSRSWIAVFDEFGNIIDWICPRCHKNINYDIWSATYCPWCGLRIFARPSGRLDGPFSRDARAWERFIFESHLVFSAQKPKIRPTGRGLKHEEH